MKSILIFFTVYILSFTGYEKNHESRKVSQNSIVIDKVLMDAIERDASSIYNSVLIAGDTITILEDLEVHGISFIIICEQLNSKGKILILPNKINQEPFDAKNNGRDGYSVTIYSKSKVDGTFILSGGHGHDGQKGADGKSGDSKFDKNELSRHLGEIGKNGEPGGNGGNGGDLKIFTLQQGSIISLESKGGKPGKGGPKGKGGITYIRMPMFPENEPVKPGITKINEKDGLPGKDGTAGINGKLYVNVVSESSFSELIKKYGFTELRSDSTFARIEFL